MKVDGCCRWELMRRRGPVRAQAVMSRGSASPCLRRPVTSPRALTRAELGLDRPRTETADARPNVTLAAAGRRLALSRSACSQPHHGGRERPLTGHSRVFGGCQISTNRCPAFFIAISEQPASNSPSNSPSKSKSLCVRSVV